MTSGMRVALAGGLLALFLALGLAVLPVSADGAGCGSLLAPKDPVGACERAREVRLGWVLLFGVGGLVVGLRGIPFRPLS